MHHNNLWLNLLWTEATTAIAESQACPDKVCACQCVADLAAVAYANEARELLPAG